MKVLKKQDILNFLKDVCKMESPHISDEICYRNGTFDIHFLDFSVRGGFGPFQGILAHSYLKFDIEGKILEYNDINSFIKESDYLKEYEEFFLGSKLDIGDLYKEDTFSRNVKDRNSGVHSYTIKGSIHKGKLHLMNNDAISQLPEWLGLKEVKDDDIRALYRGLEECFRQDLQSKFTYGASSHSIDSYYKHIAIEKEHNDDNMYLHLSYEKFSNEWLEMSLRLRKGYYFYLKSKNSNLIKLILKSIKDKSFDSNLKDQLRIYYIVNSEWTRLGTDYWIDINEDGSYLITIKFEKLASRYKFNFDFKNNEIKCLDFQRSKTTVQNYEKLFQNELEVSKGIEEAYENFLESIK